MKKFVIAVAFTLLLIVIAASPVLAVPDFQVSGGAADYLWL